MCVNFQVALMHNYATKVTYNESCLCGKIWLWQFHLSFCSFIPMAGGEETGHHLATYFDATYFSVCGFHCRSQKCSQAIN